MLLTLLSLLGGFVFLLSGADTLIKGAATLAKRAHISPFVIGLTVIGCGTSTPELVTAVQSVTSNASALMLGDVIGSNILNIFLILGVTALIYPLKIEKGTLRREGAFLFVISLGIFASFLFLAELPRWIGPILLTVLFGYLVFVYSRDRQQNLTYALPKDSLLGEPFKSRPWMLGGVILVGFIGLAIGAHLLVKGAIQLAHALGASTELIGLTIVAIGTGLPEIATSIVAAWRRHQDMAVGNILGSNIFNILGVLGIASTIAPISIPPMIKSFPIWFMLASSIFLIVYTLAGGYKLKRAEGALFLAAYITYFTLLLAQ